MEKIRRHFIFHGDVQGVGFRYRACHAAEYYGISGYVRNLSDGTVEMEAEGTECDIDNMILSIEKGHFICIENMEVKTIPICGEHCFHVR